MSFAESRVVMWSSSSPFFAPHAAAYAALRCSHARVPASVTGAYAGRGPFA